MKSPAPSIRYALWIAFAAVTILAAGCTSLSEREPTVSIPPPPLQLLSAGNLELPSDCAVPDGVVYRTNFVVDRDGRVAAIDPEPAPTCLQATLVAWLHTVQYAPPGDTVATTIDWMGVSASRSR